MPDPLERHGKGDGWDPLPSRSRLRRMAVTDEAKRSPGRKNRDLCKAAHWKGPHKPDLRKMAHRDWPCRWGLDWAGDEPRWSCFHEEYCLGCGKVLRIQIGGEECPEWHPVTVEDQVRIDASRQRQETIRADLAARKAARISVGYRKPRAS